MAMHKFCTKCRSAKPVSTIGTNGICADCMIEAVQSSEQAKEEMGNGTEGVISNETLISISRQVEGGVMEISNFPDKKTAAAFLGVSIQKVSAAIRWDKDIDGWRFKTEV